MKNSKKYDTKWNRKKSKKKIEREISIMKSKFIKVESKENYFNTKEELQ